MNQLVRSPAKREGRRLRVLLAGHGYLGWCILQALLSLKDDVEIIGIFLWSRRKGAERDFDVDEKKMVKFIQKHKLPEIRVSGMNSFDFVKVLETLKPDALMIGSWGEILKKHVLSVPDVLFINCHPSLLPTHRGAIPYCSVIRMGEEKTGVTFHLVDKGIDTGHILMQQEMSIAVTDTGGDLKDRCAELAGQMVPTLIEQLLSESGMAPMEQDQSQKSYYPALKLEDGIVYWDTEPWKLYNQVRALQPWLDCYSFLEGRVFFTYSKLIYHHLPEAVPLDKYPPTPGTVMRYAQGTIWVSSLYTDVVLGLREFKIFVWFFFLPKWFSKLIAPLLFHPGFIVSPYQHPYHRPDYVPPPEAENASNDDSNS